MEKLTKENLTKEIEAEKGLVISTDTLNTACLLTSYYQLISDYNLSDSIKKEIASFFDNEPTNENYFYSRCHILAEKEEDADYYLNEDVYNYFNDIAPDGYYFGNTEGDGSCFGFFKFEDGEEEY